MVVLRTLVLAAMVVASLASVPARACPDDAARADVSAPDHGCDNGTHAKADVCPGGS